MAAEVTVADGSINLDLVVDASPLERAIARATVDGIFGTNRRRYSDEYLYAVTGGAEGGQDHDEDDDEPEGDDPWDEPDFD